MKVKHRTGTASQHFLTRDTDREQFTKASLIEALSSYPDDTKLFVGDSEWEQLPLMIVRKTDAVEGVFLGSE